MKSTLLAFGACLVCFACARLKDNGNLFVATDFTAPGLFTKGIEGPAFDKEGNLYVVNFEKEGTIGVVSTDGTAKTFLELPQGSIANGIKFNSSGEMLLADYAGHNILKVDMSTRKVSVLAHNDSFNQPNDIFINKKDQVFATDPNWKDSTGQLWRVDPDGTTTLLAGQMGTTNGISLSPDEKILYINESLQRKIWAFDVDEAGNLSHKRIFAEFTDYGFDGMKCDVEGNLYACRYDKGVIVVISPSGKILREVPLQSKKITNLVFGGPDKKFVYVTAQDRENVEKFENDIPGL
jgi:gluconolactonase